MSENNLTQLVARIQENRKELQKEVQEKQAKLEQLKVNLYALPLDSDQESSCGNLRYDLTKNIEILLEKIKLLKERVNRDSIHIAVAGKMRQGKSQMLKMLTGVSDDIIPTGAVTACTAVRSRIENSDKELVTIHFLTEETFLQKKIYPTYNRNGLSKPRNINEFISNPLPQAEVIKSPEDNYTELEEIHKKLKIHYNELRNYFGSGSRNVSEKEVRQYNSKYYKGIEHYKYLAVDYVDVATNFPNAIPKSTVVIDLPGCNENAEGIEEETINSLKKDSDIVLIMRMPTTFGDDFNKDDKKLVYKFNDIFKNFNNLKSKDWQYLIVNEATQNGNNSEQVDAFLTRVPNDLITPIRCNCGSKETVAQMLSENLEPFAQSVQRIDNCWKTEVDQDYSAMQENVKKFLESYNGSITKNYTDKGWKKAKFEDFKNDLRRYYNENKNILEVTNDFCNKILGKICTELENKYEQIEEHNYKDKEFSIATKNEIESKKAGADNIGVLTNKIIQMQYTAILEFVFNYVENNIFSELKDEYYNYIFAGLSNSVALKKLIDHIQSDNNNSFSNEEVIEKLKITIGESFEDKTDKVIYKSFERLQQMDISVKGYFLPKLINNSAFKDLFYRGNTGENSKLQLFKKKYPESSEEYAERLFACLKEITLNIFYSIKKESYSNDISDVLTANYEAFINHAIYGINSDEEWQEFLEQNAFILYPDEYDKYMADSNNYRQIKELLKALVNFCK